MREIKFRFWQKEEKRMYPVRNIEWTNTLNVVHQICLVQRCGLDENSMFIPSQIELMQYTGLKDKTGKEIYEGDIVKGKPYGWSVNMIGVATWMNDGWFVSDESERDLEKRLHSDFVLGVEVIGNIYENQELLKEDK